MLDKLNEQHIRKTSIQLSIPEDFVKKDYFVTEAIRTLMNIKDDYYALIFKGGTSLSKGYKIVNRLSEDIDFRVIQKDRAIKLSRGAQRKKLREFRYRLINALIDVGFKLTEEDIKVFYEGRFMTVSASFEGSEKMVYLKPHIAIECFVGKLELNTQVVTITSLVKRMIGDECKHIAFPVQCVALDETTAEKWIALTRRVAGTQLRKRQSDKHLVRHLYDLYYLSKSSLLTGEYLSIVQTIMNREKQLFGKQNSKYAEDPIKVSEIALNTLFQEKEWHDHWEMFISQMVYEKNKPSFPQAVSQLQTLSNDIFHQLKKNNH